MVLGVAKQDERSAGDHERSDGRDDQSHKTQIGQPQTSSRASLRGLNAWLTIAGRSCPQRPRGVRRRVRTSTLRAPVRLRGLGRDRGVQAPQRDVSRLGRGRSRCRTQPRKAFELVDHSPISCLSTLSAGSERSPPSADLSRARARAKRERTVPTGTPSATAISWYENPSQAYSSTTSRWSASSSDSNRATSSASDPACSARPISAPSTAPPKPAVSWASASNARC